jgi:hypothetical protein
VITVGDLTDSLSTVTPTFHGVERYDTIVAMRDDASIGNGSPVITLSITAEVRTNLLEVHNVVCTAPCIAKHCDVLCNWCGDIP